MKRVLCTMAAVLMVAGVGRAQDSGGAMWIRYPAISPDGSEICFEYKGDLWVVPATVGSPGTELEFAL